MEPNNVTDIKEVSTQEFQTFKMGFDEQAIVHLMDVLTNLYSDAELAVIREYSSNAWDSHLAAGNSEPILITTPGAFNNNFVVEDFGVGMSTDDIHNIYSKYGKSTKRNNNSETGMLGLGCKSALAYVKSFTLTAIKDGVQTIATISRGEDGAGHIQILDTSSTDKRNGVKVEIPLPRQANIAIFTNKVKNFLSYWEPGRVLLDGNEPSKIDGIQVGNAMLHSGNYGQPSTVVMGGVPYPIERHNSLNFLPYGYNVTIWVGMGEVNFTPSREALHYTERTNETLQREANKLQLAMNKRLQDELAAIDNPKEAIDFVEKWRAFIKGPKWRGADPREPVALDRPDEMVKDERWPAMVFHPSAHHNQIDKVQRIAPTTLVNSMQVTGFENKTLSSNVRQKIRVYMDENSVDRKDVILTKDFIDCVWSKGVHTVDYKEILAIKLQTTKANRSIFQDVRFLKAGATFLANDVDFSKEIIMTTTAFEIGATVISRQYPESYVAVLSENRWEKFARENKTAVSVRQKIDNEIQAVAKQWNICQAIKNNLAVGVRYGVSDLVSTLQKMNASKLDDPLVSKYAGMVTEAKDDAVKRLQTARAVANGLGKSRFDRGHEVRIEVDVDELNELNAILESYPMITEGDSVSHRVDYVNAMYAYRKDNT